MTSDPQPKIGDLLHDAQLLGGAYDDAQRELTLTFECLRAQPDGARLEDRTVTLKMAGVSEAQLAHRPLLQKERPSAFALPDDARVESLNPWPFPAHEPECFCIDSKTDAETLELAAARQPLVRTVEPGTNAMMVCIHLCVGVPRLPTMLAIRCASVEPFAAGHPLSLARWTEEFEGWWRGWAKYWEAEDTVGGGADEAPLDRTYQPPAHPPFEAGSTTAPDELLAPVRAWFEANFRQDAEALARVSPNLDLPAPEHIANLRAWMTGDGFGSWGYGCEVGGWWVEGRCAYLEVFGITHFMPMDDEPAENHLERWAFALRRRGDAWQVHTYAGGTPDDELAARPWAQPWGLGR